MQLMPLSVDIHTTTSTLTNRIYTKLKRTMKGINITFTLIMILASMIDTAHIAVAGNFDPFADGYPSHLTDDKTSNESHPNVNLPSLDSIHDHVHHSPDTNETESVSNKNQSEKAGPSLDLIDAHIHPHDDDNVSAIETAKRFLIQPSIDFLDAQLHGGDEHVHDHKNQTDEAAADLNDFQRWLKEQNQTDQLKRFLLLQKEINQFDLEDTQNLSEKLSRTIEELKSEAQRKRRRKHEL